MKRRLPAAAVALTLTLLFSGALVTSNRPELLSGSRSHLFLAGLCLLVLLPLALFRGLGRIAMAIFVVDAVITAGVTSPPLIAPIALLHAVLAPVCLAALAPIAWFSVWVSPGPAINLADAKWIRASSLAAPILVLAQISMGAGYRHKVLGVLPHMGGALFVAFLLLVLPMILLQRFPDHRTLQPAATLAMTAVLLQIALGIGAFLMRLLDFDTTPFFAYLSACHVTVGSVVLGASLIFAIEVRRIATYSGLPD